MEIELIRMNPTLIEEELKIDQETATDIFLSFMARGLDLYQDKQQNLFTHEASLSYAKYNDKTKDEFIERTRENIIEMALEYYNNKVDKNLRIFNKINKYKMDNINQKE